MKAKELINIPPIEVPYWFGMLAWGLLPENRTSIFTFDEIPINSKDIGLIVLSLFYFALFVVKRTVKKQYYLRKQYKYRRLRYIPYDFYLPLLTNIIVIIGILTIPYESLETKTAKAMILALILFASPCILASTITRNFRFDRLEAFMARNTLVLASLGGLYTFFSVFSIGIGDVRSQANEIAAQVGVGRASGPLFGSSTGYFILIPALAYSIQNLLNQKEGKVFWLFATILISISTIALGARGGFICIFLFFILVILFLKSKKQSLILLAIFIFLFIPLSGVYLSKVPRVSSRFSSLESSGRMETYQTSSEIIKNRNIGEAIVGEGYASTWQWYLLFSGERTDDLVWIKYGRVLFHPHSTILFMIIEFGSIGIIYLGAIYATLGTALIRNRSSTKNTILACGIASTGVALFLDSFLVIGTRISLLWWLYLLTLVNQRTLENYKKI